MKIFKSDNYPNLLPDILLTSDMIKQAVSKFKLDFYSERNNEVEWGIRLPMFVDTFYTFIKEYKRLPSQDENYRAYLYYNQNFFNQLNRPDLTSGIKARCYRTYPSLIRDIHFNKFITERISKDYTVIYNTELDIEEGIDLMIVSENKNYGICFFTLTKNSLQGRTAKHFRHSNFDNVEYISQPINFSESDKVGDFFLYGESQYNKLYKILEEHGK